MAADLEVRDDSSLFKTQIKRAGSKAMTKPGPSKKLAYQCSLCITARILINIVESDSGVTILNNIGDNNGQYGQNNIV